MSNSLDREIKSGEEVIVKASAMTSQKPELQAIEQRVFVCHGGFGMLPHTLGTKVYGHYKIDGVEDFIRGYDIDVKETKKHQSKAGKK